MQTANGSDPTSDWNQGYGYQFWRCRHGFYRGDGAFGQFCIVMPQYDAVVAITSGTGDMQAVMNLVWDKICLLYTSGAHPGGVPAVRPQGRGDDRERDHLQGPQHDPRGRQGARVPGRRPRPVLELSLIHI